MMSKQEQRALMERMCELCRASDPLQALLDKTADIGVSPSQSVEVVISVLSNTLLASLQEPLAAELRRLRDDALRELVRLGSDMAAINRYMALVFMNTVMAKFGSARAYEDALRRFDPANRDAMRAALMCSLHERKKDQFCAGCGRGWATKKCAGCRVAFYCDAACQTEDWKAGHKAVCNKNDRK